MLACALWAGAVVLPDGPCCAAFFFLGSACDDERLCWRVAWCGVAWRGVQVVESHQARKVDVSGTAREVVAALRLAGVEGSEVRCVEPHARMHASGRREWTPCTHTVCWVQQHVC